MSIVGDYIPPHHLEFLDQLEADQAGIIVMKDNEDSSAEATIRLDIRLHEGGDKKSYLVGLVNPHGTIRSKTDVPVMEAGTFKHRFNLEPEGTPQYNDYYLGPFDREQTLTLMEAAEHLAVQTDLDEKIVELAKRSNMHNTLAKACSEEFNFSCAVKRQEKLEAARGRLRLVSSTTKGGPGPS